MLAGREREWEGVGGERKEGEKDLQRPGYTRGSSFLLPITLCSFTERRLELTGPLAQEGGPPPGDEGAQEESRTEGVS